MLASAHFWTDAWRFTTLVQVAVAIGTIGAAVAAAKAIKAANKAAAAAVRQARASRQALQASIRPLIVEMPPEQHLQRRLRGSGGRDSPTARLTTWATIKPDGTVHIGLRIRNIGSGPAVLKKVAFGAGDTETANRTAADQTVVPVDGPCEVSITRAAAETEHEAFRSSISSGSPLRVEITYTDIADGQRTVTSISLEPGVDDQYEVASLDFHPEGSHGATKVVGASKKW